MIGWLEGALRVKTPSRVVIVTGGVGYEACISLTTFTELPDEGKTVAMHVYTHVREDVLQLYGFASALERAVFELLLRTSGVGPRLALAILSGLEPHALLDSISKGAVARLRAIPGVGPKMAERIVVELRERAGELAREQSIESASSGDSPLRGTPIVPPEEEAVSALVNLGYPRAQAQRLVEEAKFELGADASLEQWLKSALRRSSR